MFHELTLTYYVYYIKIRLKKKLNLKHHRIDRNINYALHVNILKLFNTDFKADRINYTDACQVNLIAYGKFTRLLRSSQPQYLLWKFHQRIR